MRRYESIYILKPTLEEEAITALVERFSTVVTEQGGRIEKIDQWGIRRLAYPIRDFKEGYYVLMLFDAEAEVPSELERIYKIQDDVIRYMIVRDDE